MKNISARLKEKMNTIKNNQGNINTSVVNTELKAVNPFDSLYSEEDFSYINEILEEEDLREFLKDRTKKLLIQKDFTVIFLGNTLEEVFQKIGNHKNGTYQKWLHLVGINERTALRYRNKANLFKKAISFNAKKVIFELSHDNIQVILDNKDIEEKVLNSLVFIKNYIYICSVINNHLSNSKYETITIFSNDGSSSCHYYRTIII